MIPTISQPPALAPAAKPDPIAGAGEIPGPSGTDSSFGDLLSALNPLQYLPVVGTIYRAVTGDTVPEGLRVGGSLCVSFLMGGPVGLAIGAVSALVQKLTGIDPDAMAHDAMVSLGVLSDDAPRAQLASSPPTVPEAARAAYGMPAAPTSVSPQQPACTSASCSTALAAYGQALRSYGPMLGHV